MKIENYREAFLSFLNETSFRKEPKNLYEPIAYIMSLGGKRMRPVLTLMGCDLFGGEIDEAMRAALSVETFHNFTLIHDDIMDKADLRRGQATVHKKWDLNTAVLSGDALMILSNQCLEYYDGKVFKKLVSLYNRTALEVCEGQQLDIDFETLRTVDLDEYIKMISYKTAVLVGASLKMGAIVAGATEIDQDGIYDFGLNLGIAFQLQDDYLDTFGTEDFGKKIGGDIIEAKKTFLYIKALEMSNPQDKERLITLYTNEVNKEEKIREVKSIFQKYSVDQLLLNEIEKYTTKAIVDIDSLHLEEIKKKEMKFFAKSLMTRKT